MRIKQLIKSLDTIGDYSKLEDFTVSGISCNSKDIAQGSIFIAIRGARHDGHSFIDQAGANGAGAVIVEGLGQISKPDSLPLIRVKDSRKALAKLAAEFYGNPSSRIKVVGITGTNGKTTVTYLLEGLLKEAGIRPAVIGTINYRFNDKIIASKNTTPGPIDIQSLLRDMLKEAVEYAIIEVSSHALDQSRTAGIDFHSAIFTNLTQDHLDYHKTQEGYFLAKAGLFKNIGPKAFAVLNNDDRYAQRLKKITQAEIITYGIDSKADILARDIRFHLKDTRFYLVTARDKIEMTSPLIGRHNVYNILAAASWAKQIGLSLALIKSALQKSSLVPGRLERIDSQRGFSIFVDYAHTEDALRNVLLALRQLSRKRIIVVFGCGGERDKTKRPKMGRAVSELSDYAVITNDNPRSEDPGLIIKDIEKGIGGNNYSVVPDRLEAIKKALSLAKAGDIVLVAGKGHENYQVYKDKITAFSDPEAVKECLRLMN